jgi:hypothetical protein
VDEVEGALRLRLLPPALAALAIHALCEKESKEYEEFKESVRRILAVIADLLSF